MEQRLFEELKFMQVQGTSSPDGVQFVRITLQKQYGRRLKAIPNILSEYNIKSAETITPVLLPGMIEPFICFKLSHAIVDNPILNRIEMDSATSRYWRWDLGGRTIEAKTMEVKLPKQSKPPKLKSIDTRSTKSSSPSQHLIQIIKTFLEESGYDPTTVCLEDIGNSIRRSYLNATDGELRDFPKLSNEDIIFVRAEMTRYIERERMYLVSPPIKTDADKNAQALAASKNFTMDDLLHGDEAESIESSLVNPNKTILHFFKEMLPGWAGLDTVCLSSKDIVHALNQNDAGVYRHTCIPAFMNPFINTGCVDFDGKMHYVIHVHRLRSRFNL